MLKIVKKMLKIGDFQHFFNFFFNILFSTFFWIFELALQCSFKWSLVAELFLYKWPSYRGFTASKIVHLIAQIVPIQKIDPYIYIYNLATFHIKFLVSNFKISKKVKNSKFKKYFFLHCAVLKFTSLIPSVYCLKHHHLYPLCMMATSCSPLMDSTNKSNSSSIHFK